MTPAFFCEYSRAVRLPLCPRVLRVVRRRRAIVNNDCVNLQSCLVNLLKASETLQSQFPPVVNRRDDFNLFSSSIHLAQTLLNRFRHFQCRLPTQNRFRFAHIGDSDSHIVFERHGRFKL